MARIVLKLAAGVTEAPKHDYPIDFRARSSSGGDGGSGGAGLALVARKLFVQGAGT